LSIDGQRHAELHRLTCANARAQAHAHARTRTHNRQTQCHVSAASYACVIDHDNSEHRQTTIWPAGMSQWPARSVAKHSAAGRNAFWRRTIPELIKEPVNQQAGGCSPTDSPRSLPPPAPRTRSRAPSAAGSPRRCVADSPVRTDCHTRTKRSYRRMHREMCLSRQIIAESALCGLSPETCPVKAVATYREWYSG
jgi:hypothetical protein